MGFSSELFTIYIRRNQHAYFLLNQFYLFISILFHILE